MSKEINLFVSYAHQDDDDKQVEPFLNRFQSLCNSTNALTVKLWQDKNILPGQRWRAEIEKALSEADFGLLLLSPAFFASSFIQEFEIPRFIALPDEPMVQHKKAVPVLLRPVPTRHLKDAGVFEHQVFMSKKRAFNEMSGTAGKDRFVNELFNRFIAVAEQ